MCLKVNSRYGLKPDGTVRYKVFGVCPNGRLRSLFSFCNHNYTLYKVGQRKTKNANIKKLDARGFHVLTSLKYAKDYKDPKEVIHRVRCYNFIAGGCKQEIWRTIEILEEIKNK